MPTPAAAGDPETSGLVGVVGAGDEAGGCCEGEDSPDGDDAGGAVERCADGDRDEDGDDTVRVGVTFGEGLLVGVIARDGEGFSDGERTGCGDGVMVEAGTTTAGEGVSGGRTNRYNTNTARKATSSPQVERRGRCARSWSISLMPTQPSRSAHPC